MRIQHNIPAMSAYRNYTNNVSAMKKNLEKLSSGYKINRAGDDAAGLAISEKMRAQITGLETAQKNAKDGISLVQTAEGALTEVHDMLNRMVELATMSANGTYDNATDRAQLQKEMDQLNSEINRIADSANFNGIKLLDGSMETITTPADELGMNMSDISNTGALTHLADGVAADSPAVKTKFELDLSQVKVVNAGQALDVTNLSTALAGLTPTLANNTLTNKATTITYDLTGIDFDMPTDADGNVIDGGTLKFTFAGQEIEVKADSTVDTTDNGGTAGDKKLNGAQIAAAIAAKFGTSEIDINGVKFKMTEAAGEITLTEVGVDTTGDGTADTFDGATITAATDAPAITAAAGNPAKADRVVKVTLGDGTNAITLDGGTDITIAFNKTMSGKEIAAEFIKNLGSTKEVEINGTKFTVSNDNGKLTFEEKEDPTGPFTGNLTAKLDVYEDDGTTLLASAGGDNTNHKNDKGVTINQGEGIGVNIVQKGKSAETRHMAQATVDLAAALGGKIKDGDALKIGNETYIFAVGSDSEYKDSANVIDLTHKKADDADLAAEASRVLSNVAKDNEMFLVTTDNATGVIRITERLNSGIDYTKNNLQGSTADHLKDASEADWKDLIQAGIANPDAKPETTTGGLVLQIGDTADDYNQLRVSISDMHAASLSLDKIKISDQASAAAAVNVIKDAINKVSDVRGTLGATQNRLDHTINNLSVMTENIQDAESTIRDVDVAEEMMAYTKNNILIQSAQAMLAQANQMPQGVLQLLQ